MRKNGQRIPELALTGCQNRCELENKSRNTQLHKAAYCKPLGGITQYNNKKAANVFITIGLRRKKLQRLNAGDLKKVMSEKSPFKSGSVNE